MAACHIVYMLAIYAAGACHGAVLALLLLVFEYLYLRCCQYVFAMLLSSLLPSSIAKDICENKGVLDTYLGRVQYRTAPNPGISYLGNSTPANRRTTSCCC